MKSPGIERLQERFAILQARHGYSLLDAESFAEFAEAPGTTLILFADDPAKVPETWDLTVILPEALLRMEAKVRVGLLPPVTARSLAARYGIRIWPALLGLRDGAYLGTVEGLKDWSAYVRLLPELFSAPPSRPPGIGIPVMSADAASHCDSHCH
ncbi:MAG: hydrogenase [Betaproteobacteria bacterium]|nr:hydrogenase [Betaproteobacteria bacterium]